MTVWTTPSGSRTYYRPATESFMYRWADAHPAYWWWGDGMHRFAPERAVQDDFGDLVVVDLAGRAR